MVKANIRDSGRLSETPAPQMPVDDLRLGERGQAAEFGGFLGVFVSAGGGTAALLDRG